MVAGLKGNIDLEGVGIAAGDSEGSGPRRPPVGEPKTRRPEMEDWLNARVYHPLAGRLARLLAATPITPNAVSVAGGAFIVAAALLYTEVRPAALAVVLGFTAHALWHVFDGADGDLARLTGKTSPVGEMVDGACDYLGHIILYVFLAAFLDDWIGGWAWLVAALAGASRVAQSNHAESRRRTYLWRVYDVPWLKHSYETDREGPDSEGLGRRTWFLLLIEPLARLYVAAASAGGARSERIDALLERARRAPAARDRSRRVCKEESRLPLRLQTILGPNLRTVALGLSMAAGSPLWFFLLELVPFNLLMAWSILAQRRAERRIIERLEGNAAILGG